MKVITHLRHGTNGPEIDVEVDDTKGPMGRIALRERLDELREAAIKTATELAGPYTTTPFKPCPEPSEYLGRSHIPADSIQRANAV